MQFLGRELSFSSEERKISSEEFKETSEESNETSEESNHKSEEFAVSSGANQKYPPSYLEIPREDLEQAYFYMRQPCGAS